MNSVQTMVLSRALNGMEIEIERGQTLGLVGETGAGKTTTGLSLLRLIPDPPGVIVSGTIKLDGKDILQMDEKEMQKLRGKAVAMIFQDPMTSLDPVMTVEDQIAEVIRLHEEGSKQDHLKRAREMLELVGIPGTRRKRVSASVLRRYEAACSYRYGACM